MRITDPGNALAVWSPSPTTLGLSLAEIGRDKPTVYDDSLRGWLVLRHRDISAALRNPMAFSNRHYGVGSQSSGITAQDGDEHRRQRRIYNRIFRPAALERYQRLIMPIAHEVFGALDGKDQVDLAKEVFARYPVDAFVALFGAPRQVGDHVIRWVRDYVRWLLAPKDSDAETAGMNAMQELADTARQLVERELAEPTDGLLGEIVRSHQSEDAFSIEACCTAIKTLMLGAIENTIQMTTATVASILLNPNAAQRAVADRTLWDTVITESFRWANPTVMITRLVVQDVEIAGTTIPAGELAWLSVAAGHYDEEVYPRPDVFDLDRRQPAHLGLGAGPHYCVGGPLARMEVRAALDVLFDRFPQVRLDPEQPPSFGYGARDFVLHGTNALHVLL
jgi:cytochrome P450